jgi:hypothetical protein
MQRGTAPGVWMEIHFDRAGAEVRVTARGSRGEQTAPLPLGADLTAAHLGSFAAAVQAKAARGRPLGALLEQAQAIHRAVVREGIHEVRARLGEAAASAPLLLRLQIHDAELKAVPWEALCGPGEAMGFWASAPDLLPVRSVITLDPWQPREVRGALRVLALAPSGGASLAVLKDALADRIASGEVEWLPPIEGPAAGLRTLFERLRREPTPHVLHFLGHGGMQAGVPVLRLADNADGEEQWLAVELLADQLKMSFGGFLRLVVLEACEGARAGAFGSAAEILAKAGADAVVAHLWPVKADVGRLCSEQLYRALAGGGKGQGDIAQSLNEARRAILGAFEGSAEAFSPVVYLRGPDGVLFDFKGRKVAPAAPQRTVTEASRGIEPALVRLVRGPFALLLGDRWKGERAALAGFRDKLHQELAKLSVPASPELPMSALTQRFALRRGADKLGVEFQKAFRSSAAIPPVVVALSRLIGPGVHTTLLRSPWLEQALAEQQPERTIYAIQPGEEGARVLRRQAHGDWEELEAPPASIDLEQEIVLLRLYRGYTPEQVFTRPLLTEDDYLFGLRELEGSLPRDLANAILGTLSYRPALFVGLSMLTWHHRMLLHRLYPRGIPRGSLSLIEPADAERELWEKGLGLPGKGEVGGVEVVEADTEALVSGLEALVEEDTA